MLASPANQPLSNLLNGQFIFEPKYDGIRCVTQDGRLYSRAGNDITSRFPEIQIPSGVDLDGELIMYENGRPSFNAIQHRTSKNARYQDPARFMVFDLLAIAGRSTASDVLVVRKQLLLGQRPRFSEHVHLVPWSSDGQDVWNQAQTDGHEGVIAKLRHSLYSPGRSKAWLKVKKAMHLSAIVVGASEGSGRRAGTFGALQLALLDTNNQIQPIGEVGTGFTDRDLEQLAALLSKGQPFIVDIECMEVTKAQALRFPSYRGVRDDISIFDCTTKQLEG